MEIDRIGHDAVKRRSRGGEITGHDGAKYAACVDISRINAVMKFLSIDRDPERLMLAYDLCLVKQLYRPTWNRT